MRLSAARAQWARGGDGCGRHARRRIQSCSPVLAPGLHPHRSDVLARCANNTCTPWRPRNRAAQTDGCQPSHHAHARVHLHSFPLPSTGPRSPPPAMLHSRSRSCQRGKGSRPSLCSTQQRASLEGGGAGRRHECVAPTTAGMQRRLVTAQAHGERQRGGRGCRAFTFGDDGHAGDGGDDGLGAPAGSRSACIPHTWSPHAALYLALTDHTCQSQRMPPPPLLCPPPPPPPARLPSSPPACPTPHLSHTHHGGHPPTHPHSRHGQLLVGGQHHPNAGRQKRALSCLQARAGGHDVQAGAMGTTSGKALHRTRAARRHA